MLLKGGKNIEILMSEHQKKYYNAMQKMCNKKPQKAFPRPKVLLNYFISQNITSDLN